MSTAILTNKGQITIPAAVREALGVGAGDRVEFVEVAPGRYEFIAATRPVTETQGHVRRAAQGGVDRRDERGDRTPRRLGRMIGLDNQRPRSPQSCRTTPCSRHLRRG